jgi:outer membrane protein TolC
MIRKLKILLAFATLPFWGMGQEKQRMSLAEAWQLAETSYPQTKQKDIINRTAGLTVENLSKQFVPQLSISGQASYQSEVTQVKIPVPGINITPPSKDQYKVVADLNQLIYDGGAIKLQQQAQQLNAGVEQQKIAVDLYRLRERVSQVYMGILYLDEQQKQVDLIEADIRTGIQKTEAQVANGTAFRSQVLLLKAELLKVGQRRTEIFQTRKGWVEVLSLLTHSSLREDLVLSRPEFALQSADTLARPELELIKAQQRSLENQIGLLQSRNRPKASLFVQGGYGRPGLNFLDNDFRFFYVGGIRFSWALTGLYTHKRDKTILENNRELLDAQKETFLLNTRSQLSQQWAEIRKLEQLILSDQQIIELRQAVSQAVKSQLDNGVITASDYLREVNAEDQARQALITHQVQLIQAKLNYTLTAGQ